MKNKHILIYSAAIFLFSYLIYILTSAPGLTFTDSGELAAACVTLGIAHPTGYPLFTLLGHLWTYLPIPGTEIYSLNLFAGFLTAVSAFVFFNTILLLLSFLNSHQERKATNKKQQKGANVSVKENALKENHILVISISSALVYAFARTVWAQAVAIEVYSLHLLMMNLVLFFFFKGVLTEGNGKNYLFASALFLGLSFTNHMTTILMIPMLLYFYFKRPGQKANLSSDNFKYLFILIIPFLIGLSLYLYLPLRSAAMPEFNWGWVSRNFDKFWYHFSGKQYQVWMFSGSDVMKENLIKFFSSVPEQIAWIGILPFILGLFELYRKSKTLFYGILILIISCVFYSINYSIHDIDSYFVTAFAGIIIITAAGLLLIARKIPNFAYSFFILPVVALAINYVPNDRSDDELVPEYTRILLQKLEPHAVIFSSQWDFWVSAAWYMQKVEGIRTDVVIIDKELMRRTWYLEQLKRWYPEQVKQCKPAIDDYLIDLELFESGGEYSNVSIQRKFVNSLRCLIETNMAKYPVYMTLDVVETEPDIHSGLIKSADGFAFRLLPESSPHYVTTKDINIVQFVNSIKSNDGYLVDAIKSTAAICLVNVGRYALMNKDKEEARSAFEKAFRIDPANRFVIEGMNNLNNMKFE